MIAAVDNDIVVKGACYGLLPQLCGPTGVKTGSYGVLSSVQFVAKARIRKATITRGVDVVLRDLTAFLSTTLSLDPTEEEQYLAANLELAAQELGVPLDTGESQLCAIVVHRSIPALLTGDKRAIAAMEALLRTQLWLQGIRGKVRCLEQAVLLASSQAGFDTIRSAVCAEMAIDKALTYCFGCYSESVDRQEIASGLMSYIIALRTDAPNILANTESESHNDCVRPDKPSNETNVHGRPPSGC